MTATALNSASIAPAAQAAPGAPAAAVGGALAGFEALLAALFPQSDPTAAAPAAPAATSAPANTPVLVDGEAAPAEGEGLETPAADAEPAVGDAAAALAASLVAAQPATAQAATTAASKASEHTPPAWGRDKAKGVPAMPALLNGAGKGELAPEGLDETAPTGKPQDLAATTPHSAAGPQRAAAPSSAPPAAPQPQAAPPTDLAVDAAPPPVAAQPQPEAPPAEAPPAATAAATAAAASLVARPESAPAPAPTQRSAKSERAKAPADAIASAAPGPLEAVDKPVHARPVEGVPKADDATVEAAEVTADDARPADEAPDGQLQAEARAASQASTPAAHTAHAVRGSPETVANLAAQILKKLDGQSTRFDLELDPHGLGKVDVRIEIGATGRITAAMTFDNPQAAADVKARSAELHRMLEQAGFDLSGGVSFDVAGDRGGQPGQAWQDQAETGHAFRGHAFRQALETAGDAADAANQGALRLRRGVSAGLDLRI